MLRRRGIRLKHIGPDDPGIQELLDSDLCQPEEAEEPEEPDDPAVTAETGPTIPPLSEVAREVLEGLRDTLAVLERNIADHPPPPSEGKEKP
jgi:hypothetical protein